MPATSPRITVTITDELSVALKRLSQLTRQSQSSLVGELLAQSLPVFERMVQLMEAVSAINEKVDKSAKSIREGMDAAHSQLEATLMGLEALLPEGGGATPRGGLLPASGVAPPPGAGQLGTYGETVRHGAAAPPVAVTTPMSNRGVRSSRRAQTQGNRGVKKVGEASEVGGGHGAV